MNATESVAPLVVVIVVMAMVLLVPGMGSSAHIGVLDRELVMAERVFGTERAERVRRSSAQLIAQGLDALDARPKTELGVRAGSSRLLETIGAADRAKPAEHSLWVRWREGAVAYLGLVVGRVLVFLPLLPWVALVATAIIVDGFSRRKLRLLAFGGITPLYYQVAWRGMIGAGVAAVAVFVLPVAVHPLVPPVLWIAVAGLLSLYLIHSARPL